MYVDVDGNKCGAKSIASHTLQRAGALHRIAEGGHLYKLQMNMFASKFEETLDFREIGKSKASIFPGFCKKHDTSIFAEVEQDTFEITKRSLLLLAYRVICMEIFQKELNVKIYSDRNLTSLFPSMGMASFASNFILSTKEGLRDLGRMKLAYEAAIHH